MDNPIKADNRISNTRTEDKRSCRSLLNVYRRQITFERKYFVPRSSQRRTEENLNELLAPADSSDDQSTHVTLNSSIAGGDEQEEETPEPLFCRIEAIEEAQLLAPTLWKRFETAKSTGHEASEPPPPTRLLTGRAANGFRLRNTVARSMATEHQFVSYPASAVEAKHSQDTPVLNSPKQKPIKHISNDFYPLKKFKLPCAIKQKVYLLPLTQSPTATSTFSIKEGFAICWKASPPYPIRPYGRTRGAKGDQTSEMLTSLETQWLRPAAPRPPYAAVRIKDHRRAFTPGPIQLDVPDCPPTRYVQLMLPLDPELDEGDLPPDDFSLSVAESISTLEALREGKEVDHKSKELLSNVASSDYAAVLGGGLQPAQYEESRIDVGESRAKPQQREDYGAALLGSLMEGPPRRVNKMQTVTRYQNKVPYSRATLQETWETRPAETKLRKVRAKPPSDEVSTQDSNGQRKTLQAKRVTR